MEILNYILTDIKEPVTWLPIGILFGVLVESVVCFYRIYQKKQRQTWKEMIVVALFAAYLLIVLIQTLFSREPGSRHGMDMIPFSTWGTNEQSHAYMIENVILFLPFGILFPMAKEKNVHWKLIFACSFCFSVSLETVQLLTGRGFCQVDDVIMNTLGGCLGYLIYRGIKFLKHLVSDN